MCVGQDVLPLYIDHKRRPRRRALGAHLPRLPIVGVNLGAEHCDV